MPQKEIDLCPGTLQFSVFNEDDIKNLSVVKIITGLAFDSLGRPYPGGLYDRGMGCFGKNLDLCTTCFLTTQCPGHFGRIELSAYVYNPFFLKLVYDILRVSCLNCFRLQLKKNVEDILCLQLNLVEAGYIIEAQEIEILKAKNSETDNNDGNNICVHPKIIELQNLLENGEKNLINHTKISCAIRSSLIATALENFIAKKCIHCHSPFRRVKKSYKRIVLNIMKAELEQLKESGITNLTSTKILLADESRKYLRNIFSNHSKLLRLLFPLLNTNSCEHPTDVFFNNMIAVVPSKLRPPSYNKGSLSIHPQSIIYKDIIDSNYMYNLILNYNKRLEIDNETASIYEKVRGNNQLEKLYYAWQQLQDAVDQLLETSADKSGSIKELFEKKEGLIRKNMMGKRVNYAARTVITPDPYINVDEIGIPDAFAKRLSYPVPVTAWNIADLRHRVMNGPSTYPGANYIETQKGHKIFIPEDSAAKRESIAKCLLTNPQDGFKIVYRHLVNGDMLLLNRQPTLHRPGIMAHKAKVLEGEKTFRLHYSNCKSYNADFDGDEMNAHFPQNEMGRSEAYNLVNVSNQYLVPKDGTPLGGLIQDHVISGVKLSIRGRFFNKEDYQQLVFQGVSHLQGNIKLLPPAIIKPIKLWSGKQVLSTIIINLIPKGMPRINLTSHARIANKFWNVNKPNKWIYGGTLFLGDEMSESEVIIKNGELLCGVLDKQQYGATAYGLIHCMYELYGGNCSTQLLTSLTKVFTTFLQTEGFTLGVEDILVTREADEKRKQIIKECRKIGNSIAAQALNLEEIPENLGEYIEEGYKSNPKFRLILDRAYKSVLDEFTNKINSTCLPGGLYTRFPNNNLQLMVLSGAKGSLVNTMQISCLLGQIELEGKRPPLMLSGKSLPSFPSFETSPKSGGFIDGRFMTGIQPQEFFFHCMAGREGLIDTAVKTSRSGYLQRCLTKHLEGLTINYDLTVRDSDGTVVQFMYGEDGLDIPKAQFLKPKSFKYLEENSDVILKSNDLNIVKINDATNEIHSLHKKLKSWYKKNGNPCQKRRRSDFQQFSAEVRNEIEVVNANKLNKKSGRTKFNESIIDLWQKADIENKKRFKKKFTKCPDPLTSKYRPDSFYGSISEYLENLAEIHIKKKPEKKNIIMDLIYAKSIKSISQPGEPVGLLAAQSVGEPSTQMTLNTFHFAGRGEMNVTLGIPRLREILMFATKNIKTPSMDIPFKPSQYKNAEKLRIKLNKVTLADVLEYINIKMCLILKPKRSLETVLYFKFLPHEAYKGNFCVKPKNIIKYMNEDFFKLFFKSLEKTSKFHHTIIDVDDKTSKNAENEKENAEDIDETSNKREKESQRSNDSSDDESLAEDDGAGIRLKNKKQDEKEYENSDEEMENEDEINENDEEVDMLEKEEIPENQNSELLETLISNCMVKEYKYDEQDHLWCQLTINLGMKYKDANLSTILKELAQKSVINEIPKIRRAITYKNNDDLILKTEGINIVEIFKYNKQLDLNRLYSNDIHAIAMTYGIEAATRVIVKEIQNVFKVYGITVDPRHLLLIADYMTFDGTFKPLSRKGMENSSSPLQQMSFESCLQFLKTSTIKGMKDNLDSPSSRLMVGLPIKNGTGCFSLLAKYW